MILYINDEQIDFVFEQEKTLYDVLTALEKELKKTNASISTILVNDISILHNEEAWKKTPIDEVQVLKLEADLIPITLAKQIDTITHIIQMLEQLATQSLPLQGISQEDILYIIASIDSIGIKSTVTHKPLSTIFQYICQSIGAFSVEQGDCLQYPKDIEIHFHHLYSALKQRRIAILQDDTKWIQSNKEIEQYLPLFKDIPKFLEHTQGILGITQLIVSIDIFSLWLQTLSSVPIQLNEQQKTTWSELHQQYTTSLKEFFEELSEAIEHKDWVTINDLIEYEISPLVSEYSSKAAEYYPKKSPKKPPKNQ